MPGLEYRITEVFSLRTGLYWAAGDESGAKFDPFKKDQLYYILIKANF